MSFDVTQITETTKPTKTEVFKLFEEGKLPAVKQTQGEQKLIKQWGDTGPLAALTLPAFKDLEIDITQTDIVTGYRLVELLAAPTADRATIEAGVGEATKVQSTHIETIRRQRDDLVRLAKDRGVSEKLFRVNLGEGDASNALPGARVLVVLVEKHGGKLNAPKVVAGILKRIKSAVAALDAAEVSQETGKHERTLPTKTLEGIRDTLYALMLRISRLGPVALPDATDEERAKFSLTVLRSTPGSARGADDDDAPVVDVTEQEAGTPIPPGNVAGLPGRG